MSTGKSYSINDLTIIGRKEFDLGETWHCFFAEVTDGGKGDKLRYGLARKDENGEWNHDVEMYAHVSLI